MLTTKARDVDRSTLHAHFATAYGVFAGQPKATARLVFSAFRARWVSQVDSAQRGEFLADGRYQCDILYGDPRERVMDILKHGDKVEVVGAPGELRALVTEALKAALMHHADGPDAAPDKAFGGITD